MLIWGIQFPLAVCNAEESGSRDPTPAERAWIASKLYASASHYFAHGEGVPQLNLDDWYRSYLAKAMRAVDRREFSLASMEFVAGLRNGHSQFDDEWLRAEFGRPLGFSLTPIGGQWIVTDSRLEDLGVGEEIVGIDGETFDEFFHRQKRYIGASSESERVQRLFYMPHLFPESFDLVLESGNRRNINRNTQTLKERSGQSLPQPGSLGNGIVYLPIRSFSKPEFEQDAIAFIDLHKDAETLIIDVRGNSGGSTPTLLIKSLMDRPWSGWGEATPFRLAVNSAYAQTRRLIAPDQLGEYWQGYIDALSEMDGAMLMFPSKENQPDRSLFTNDLIVLVDQQCASACEGFVMPLRFSGRATVIGRPTFGSSGQPYMFDFGNGMSFRISAKRMYFPDGSRFEGVGIAPNIEVPITLDSVLSEADEILDQAIETALANRP